jgi:DUF4097 and DUF4098 domain-containing protein YvlB
MSEIIEKTFTVVSPARLNLSNIRGSVEIRPAADGVIHVTATRDERSGDASRTLVELSQDSDGTVRAVTRFPEGAWSWLIGSFPCKVDYVVQAPRNCTLKLNAVSSDILAGGFAGEFSIQTVSGEVSLNDLTGPTRIKSVSGAIELTDLNGDLRLNTVSGKVTGRHVSGALHLDTVSGDITLAESNLPSVEASTVSGRMRYQTPFGLGPYRFNSVSGDVELLVPPETRCAAELHAISGQLSTQLPATSVERHNGTQTVQVQGGGVKVFLQSVSGNLLLAS